MVMVMVMVMVMKQSACCVNSAPMTIEYQAPARPTRQRTAQLQAAATRHTLAHKYTLKYSNTFAHKYTVKYSNSFAHKYTVKYSNTLASLNAPSHSTHLGHLSRGVSHCKCPAQNKIPAQMLQKYSGGRVMSRTSLPQRHRANKLSAAARKLRT